MMMFERKHAFSIESEPRVTLEKERERETISSSFLYDDYVIWYSMVWRKKGRNLKGEEDLKRGKKWKMTVSIIYGLVYTSFSNNCTDFIFGSTEEKVTKRQRNWMMKDQRMGTRPSPSASLTSKSQKRKKYTRAKCLFRFVNCVLELVSRSFSFLFLLQPRLDLRPDFWASGPFTTRID